MKELFSKIKKQVQEETPELDLQKILTQAIIPENDPQPVLSKKKWFLQPFFKLATSLALVIVLIVLIIPSSKDPSTGNDSSPEGLNTPAYLNSALSLYFLSEEKEKLTTDESTSEEVEEEIEFVNQYLKTLDTYYSEAFFDQINGDWLFNSKITIKISEKESDKKTELEIKIIDQDKEHLLSGYYSNNELYLKLNLNQNTYLEMTESSHQVEYKRIEIGKLTSYAQIRETVQGIELRNLTVKDMGVFYLINKNDDAYNIEYYQFKDFIDSEYSTTPGSEAKSPLENNSAPEYIVIITNDSYSLE